MTIKHLLAIAFLIHAALVANGQQNGKKAPAKKPVAAKIVAPVVQTIRFTLRERCDYGDMVLYTGEVKNGKANGHGKAFIYFNEVTDTTNQHLGVYEGEWKDNAFHGKGSLHPNFDGYSSGKTVYRGDFENGKYHGQGKLWPMYNDFKEGRFDKGVYIENSAPVATVKNEAPAVNKPPAAPAAKPGSSTRPPGEMFYAQAEDFANIDWEALGRRPQEPGYTTGAKIAFLEEVSKDVRKYLNETYTKNGATYKRYRRSREVESNNQTVYSGQDVQLTGRSTPVLILTYCKNFGNDATAKVSVNYAGYGKKTDNTILTGASCNVVTQCNGNICKTACNGSIDLEFGSSKTLWLNKEGNWNGLEKVYWVVLADLK